MRRFHLLAALLALPCAAHAHSASAWEEVRLHDLHGNPVRAAELADGPWILFVFIARDCPVANRSVPELNRLHQEFSARGFSVHGVYVDISANAEQLRAHAADYELRFPVWQDKERFLVRFTGARVTPEAVIVDNGGNILYSGRVDDRFGGFGQSRPAPVRRDLAEAMEALAAGSDKPVSGQPGFGCPIPEIIDECE